MVGLVEATDDDGTAVIGVRNQLRAGETLELIGPRMKSLSFDLDELNDLDGKPLTVANPNQRVRMRLPPQAAPLDILRR